MQAQLVLRLLEFQAAVDDEVIEDAIEVTIAPDPGFVTDLSWMFVGRCLRGGEWSYVLATLWKDGEAMLDAVRDGDVAVYRPAFAPYLARAAVSVLDVDASWRWCEADPLSAVRIFRVADFALAVDGAGHEPSSFKAPAPGDPVGKPCLVLSAANDVERVLLAGWPRVGQAPQRRLPPIEADPMTADVNAMSRAGLGFEYKVILDRAADSGG